MKFLKKSIILCSIFLLLGSLADLNIVQAANKTTCKKITMTAGKSKKLSIKTSSNAKYTSSKKKVATITKKGVIKAKQKGNTTIKVKVNKKNYQYKVTVEKPSLTKRASLSINSSKKLTVKNTTRSVKWSTSNAKVATVSKKGVVKGISSGTAKIKARLSDVTYTCLVTVSKKSSNTLPPQTSNPTPQTVNDGALTGLPNEISVEVTHDITLDFIANQAYTAKSEDEDVATVQADIVRTLGKTSHAKITGQRPGSTYILFKTSDGKFSKRVKVNVTASLITTQKTNAYWYNIEVSTYRFNDAIYDNKPALIHVCKVTNCSIGTEKLAINSFSLRIYDTDNDGNNVYTTFFCPYDNIHINTSDIPNSGDSCYYTQIEMRESYLSDNVYGTILKPTDISFKNNSDNFNIPVTLINKTNTEISLSNYNLNGYFDFFDFHADVNVIDHQYKNSTSLLCVIVNCFDHNNQLISTTSPYFTNILVDDEYCYLKNQTLGSFLVPDQNGDIARIEVIIY